MLRDKFKVLYLFCEHVGIIEERERERDTNIYVGVFYYYIYFL